MFSLCSCRPPAPRRSPASRPDRADRTRRHVPDRPDHPFRHPRPGPRSGGLLLGSLHEVAGAGPDTEHGAAAALFLAGVLARMEGPVLWVQEQPDLFAPGLACAGLHPARLVFAEAGKDVLAAMEEGLAHPGLAAVVGEFSGRLSLVASRRLQLGAEKSGVMAALLRRSRDFQRPRAGRAERRRHAVADRRAALRPALAARARRARTGARAVAAGPDALPGRRTGILDRGGMRCDGSSRSGCRRGPRIGCAKQPTFRLMGERHGSEGRWSPPRMTGGGG